MLELGCGAGAAILCLMTRVAGLEATGVEMQAPYADLARHNAKANGLALEVVTARIEALPKALSARAFDHVIANPPYFDANSVTSPKNASKEIAHEAPAEMLALWVDVARRRLRPAGQLTLIHRVEALPRLLAALEGPFGDISVIPITSRRDRASERVILRARKGRRGPMSLQAPLVMHHGKCHGAADDAYSDVAKSILLEAEALPMCSP